MEKAHKPDEQLAERYFLGELTDDEAEAYEAHYFDCPRCAEYVAEELAMLESGRAVALEQKRTAPVADFAAARKRKREWLPLAAAAALVLVIGAPTVLRREPPQRQAPTVLRQQTTPGMVISLKTDNPALQFSADRGPTAKRRSFRAGGSIAFNVEPSETDAPYVELSIRDAASKAVVIPPQRLTQEERANDFQWLPDPLPAGSYELVIESVREDGNRSTISSEQFEVREETQGGER